ncbi:Rod shape-determining protein MreD [uncultured Eubacteriales bacterium]|uniref:Rod shape-determining protein MreD n=1 Tax=uncultured Eubacteriales bacterium TaxID=172733 RepID=A0A212KHP4_9FIRM|nr:Rod shape-determining protein MreD [uncultured Eubacteriales bacterium]
MTALSRHDFTVKWTVFAVALLPVWFLETYILSRFPVFGVKPMLLPLAAVAVATVEGAAPGGAFGLAVGILCDALYGTSGAMTLGLTLVGVAAGLAAQYLLRQNLLGCFLCSLGALASIDGCRIIWRLLSGVELEPMLRVAGLEILWSLVFVAPIYALFRWVHSRTETATLF